MAGPHSATGSSSFTRTWRSGAGGAAARPPRPFAGVLPRAGPAGPVPRRAGALAGRPVFLPPARAGRAGVAVLAARVAGRATAFRARAGCFAAGFAALPRFAVGFAALPRFAAGFAAPRVADFAGVDARTAVFFATGFDLAADPAFATGFVVEADPVLLPAGGAFAPGRAVLAAGFGAGCAAVRRPGAFAPGGAARFPAVPPGFPFERSSAARRFVVVRACFANPVSPRGSCVVR